MRAVERAVELSAAAGRLRAFVKASGGDEGLRGLLRLADRLSSEADKALAELADQAAADRSLAAAEAKGRTRR